MVLRRKSGRLEGVWSAPKLIWAFRLLLAALAGSGLLVGVAGSVFGAEEEPDSTALSPRQLYNDGTQKLNAGKLHEAETSLQNAVASQDDRVQAPSLYNLGHTRFREGVEELTKNPGAHAAQGTAGRAFESGANAIRGADAALAGDDLEAIVAAYLRGRGARKELKSANEAVKRAMEMFGSVLAKWQRARGDFKSAQELRPADADAAANADAMDQCIAKLVDLQRFMMQSMEGMKQQREELKKKMAALKKRMPNGMQDQMKGSGEEDEEDDGNKGKQKQEPKPGEQEPESQDGKPRMLTQDEAIRLLGMLKLDADRKLPMGVGDTGDPKDKKGRDW